MNEQSGEDDLFIVAAVCGLFARPTKAFVIAEAEFLCGRCWADFYLFACMT